MDVRKLSLEAVEKIIDKKAFANIVVNEYLNKFEFSQADKALFTNIVYGTIQNLLTIDYYLAPFYNAKKTKNWAKYLLYISAYQLVYLDIPEYAVVNEAVAIANVKDHYIGSFVNGVLRKFLREPLRSFDGLDDINYLSIKYSHPAWLVACFLKDYDYETTEKILIENSKVRDCAIRINTLKASREEIMDELRQRGIGFSEPEITENGLVVFQNMSKSDLFLSGEITIQDISSQMVAEVVNPRKGSTILDLCSAPGGKAAHMAAIMENTGKILACDIYSHRIKLMEKGFNRLGVKNVKCQLIDARKVSDYLQEESVDYVLADVPCSGLGVLSHKVDLKYRLDMKSIEEIIYLQEEILSSTCQLVKINGYYIYSTCTLNKDENERQIEKFLQKNPNFEIVKEKKIMPFDYQTDGFYICKMRRIS